MKTRYVLPLCFAAAAHGALLFGFTRPVRPAKPVEKDVHYIPFPVTKVEDEPPVIVESDRKDPAPASAPDVPQIPRSAEPPPLERGEILTMLPPPFTPVSPNDLATVIDRPGGIVGGTGASPWDGKPVSSEFLDNPPRTRFQAAPIYPHDARRSSVSGKVLVEFIVDENGRVQEPRVMESSDRMFDDATLRAVSRWTFEPGKRDGRVVRFRMSAPVIFSLND